MLTPLPLQNYISMQLKSTECFLTSVHFDFIYIFRIELFNIIEYYINELHNCQVAQSA